MSSASQAMTEAAVTTPVEEESTQEGQRVRAPSRRRGVLAMRRDGGVDAAYRICKRAFDVVFSAAVIAIGAVPAIVLAAAIRHESPGSPIYRQERVNGIGPDGRPRIFTMYKFRSMYADADERLVELKAAGMNEADGPLFKMRDDPRVTRIGRFMRKHSIDEMPQFVNALLGDMSIVGPRPPLPDEVSEYGDRAMQTLSVKPGLTSYWQVSGRSDTTFDHKVDLDMDYIRDQSVTTDLKLVVKTIGIVITGGGAY